MFRHDCMVVCVCVLSDANRVKIGGCGGIERIVIAMKDHPTSVDVQYRGCGALFNLTCNNGT